MSEVLRNRGTLDAGRPAKTNWLTAILLSPVLWGGLLTIGFYHAIPYLPAERELVERYFCGHPLEYATATLFFLGLATLGLKAARLSREKKALAHDPLDDPQLAAMADPTRKVERIVSLLNALPARLQRSHLFVRIRDVCDHLHGRPSSARLEEHLKYLAELASERLHESYSPVRTITWAVPILGFLGTVIGITIAIANVTPEQLDTSLNEVTGGLAVAFDTTALALALSLVLVFSSFLVERAEQRILSRVEEYGIKRIGPLLASGTEAAGPLVEAEARAAGQLLEQTEQLIRRQTHLWQEALESLRQRWTETLELQKHDFDQALQQGMAATLENHTLQLSEIRGEFLHAFRSVSEQLTEAMADSRQAQQTLQEEHRHTFGRLGEQIRAGLIESQQTQAERLDGLMQTVSDAVAAWQTQLRQCTDAGIAQLEELRKQGDVLLKVTEQEAELTRLQERLADNLDAVRAAETLQETLHSLSAAVHLLTARARPKVA